MPWYNDPKIVKQLPVTYRGYARYRRWAGTRMSGSIGRGFFLLRASVRLTNVLRLKSRAAIRSGQTIFLVDLGDLRLSRVLNEIHGAGREAGMIRGCLSNGDTFIDVGANHGTYSLMAAGLVGPAGRVIAFEPQPHLAALLEESVKVNRLSNCEVHQIACCDSEGTAKLFVPRGAGSGQAGLHERYSATATHREVVVRTARFDTVIDWKNLPGNIFLKLDIEGSEFSFLTGAREMIRTRRPLILFELNPDSADAAGRPVAETLELLRELGYEWFSEIDRYPDAIPLGEVDRTRPRNLVALPRRERQAGCTDPSR